MWNSAVTLLDKNQLRGGPITEAELLTGSDDIKQKMCTMDSFNRFSNGTAPVHGVALPRIQIIIGTSAVQCGVSSNDLIHCKHKGLPPTMYDYLQDMGRVNQ